MAEERVIIHVDMDAFFAAIEQRDNPELQGRPVVVGADPKGGEGRGVVSTASYEARKYGIHSAQPISRAYRRRPDAVYLPVNGEKYRRESRRIREILQQFTPQVQFVSIDEAYLDVTGSLRLYGGKRQLAEAIQGRIEEERELTASLGVAPCKLVAKIASDLEKPRGLVIVEPGEEEEFLRPLEVGRIPGVGPKMRASLGEMGITSIGELADVPRAELEERFGEWGADLWRKAHGIDERPVRTGEEEPKSIGHEHTFEEDTDDEGLVRSTLMWLCEKTARRVRKAGKLSATITTKIRTEDFTTLTRQRTLETAVCDAGSIYTVALDNLEAADVEGRKLRLIGVTASGLVDVARPPGEVKQTRLFGAERPGGGDRHERIARAEDAVKDRWGEDALRRGTSMENSKDQSEG